MVQMSIAILILILILGIGGIIIGINNIALGDTQKSISLSEKINVYDNQFTLNQMSYKWTTIDCFSVDCTEFYKQFKFVWTSDPPVPTMNTNPIVDSYQNTNTHIEDVIQLQKQTNKLLAIQICQNTSIFYNNHYQVYSKLEQCISQVLNDTK